MTNPYSHPDCFAGNRTGEIPRPRFATTVVLFLIWIVFCSGCKTTPPPRTGADTLRPDHPVSREKEQREALARQPTLAAVDRAISRMEARTGIRVLRNRQGTVMIYVPDGTDRFYVPDETEDCLFEITISQRPEGSKPGSVARHEKTELGVRRGPCGLVSPGIDPAAQDLVFRAADASLLGSLNDRLDGAPWPRACSAATFIELSLNLPFRLAARDQGLEDWLFRVAEPVTNPLHLTFGDILFAGPNNRALPGIYAGNGYAVFHEDCRQARIHRLRPELQYRAYRLLTGYARAAYAAPVPERFRAAGRSPR